MIRPLPKPEKKNRCFDFRSSEIVSSPEALLLYLPLLINQFDANAAFKALETAKADEQKEMLESGTWTLRPQEGLWGAEAHPDGKLKHHYR